MKYVQEIIDKIENYAPLETQAKWDNSGWQINLHKKYYKNILTCVTVTDEIINQAIKQDCDLILAHHPFIFEPLKKIENNTIIKAIQNGIQIYSAHTTLDLAKGGTTDTLSEKCGFGYCPNIEEFINGKFLDNEIDVNILQNEIKQKLNIDCIKIVNFTGKTKIKSVAFCAGAGGSEIKKVNELGYDLFITGEVKFHESLDANDTIVFELGHYQSEKFIGEIFQKILGCEVNIIEANEKSPYYFS